MKRLALATVFCAALSGPAIAQTPGPAQADAVPAGVASPPTLSGNLGLFSSYRFRGIDQSYQPYCFTNSNSDSGGVISYGLHTRDAGRTLAVLSVSRTF